MRGKGTFVGNFNPTSCSTKKSAKSYNESLDNVIVIDDDDDGGGSSSSDVIFIHDSKNDRVEGRQSNVAFEDVISIDDEDDDDDDEISISSQPENGVEGSDDLESDATSDETSCSEEEFTWPTTGFNSDECRVSREKGSTSKFMRWRGTSSKSFFCRNRYGLTESSSSDSEFSDCEIMEDSCGEVRKKWEQAFRKRRNQVGLDDQGSASGSLSDTCKDDELGKKSALHPQATACCNSSNLSCDKEKFTAFAETANCKFQARFLDPEEQTPMGSDENVDELFFSEFQSATSGNVPTCRQENCPSYEKTCEESRFSAGQRESHIHEMGGNQDANGNSSHTTSFVSCKERIFTRQSHTCDLKSKLDIGNNKTSDDDCEDDALLKSKHMNKIPVYFDGAVFTDNKCTYSMPSNCHTSSDSQLKCKNNVSINTNYGVPGKPPKSCHSDSTQANCSNASEFKGNRNMFFASNSSFDKSGVSGAGAHLRVDKIDPGEKENEPVIESATGRDQCCDREMLQAEYNVTIARGNIITNREKLKETDEYKRAMEEELVARQEQLRIQAEEAQRLKKRKRAESMRLLEMERRQKQRLEEIRNTQKKDEENMKLKEQLRSLVRKELNALELKSYNMASLLRGLGIHVGNGFSPSSQEVHAAYKRAVLKFHPDRASRSDIRQQVEAEEKFKLIARMKDKLI